LDKAIEAYQNLLDLYPDDFTGIGNLPGLYSRTGRMDKASELSEKSRLYYPKSLIFYCNSAYFYYAQGLYDKGEELLNYYEKNISDNESAIKAYLAFSFLFRRNYDRALAEINKSLSITSSFQLGIILKGDTYLCQGDFLRAEKEYSRLLLSNEPSQLIGKAKLGALSLQQGKTKESIAQIERGLELQNKIGGSSRAPDLNLLLAYLYLRTGYYEEALDLCEKALNYAIDKQRPDWQRWALYYKGLTFIEQKSMSEAQTKADELKKLADLSLNEKAIRWHYLLLGQIELEKGNYSEAADYFT
jgi:tetratricopeptide (TPR) repeat protein